MKLTINSHKVSLTSAVRDAIRDAARLALEMLDVPPNTPIVVEIRGPGKPDSQRHSAEASIDLPDGTLRAEGFGPGAKEAVASLHGALVRQAQQWQVRNASKQGHGESTLLHGEAVDERTLRDNSYKRPKPKTPDSVSARRPLGSR